MIAMANEGYDTCPLEGFDSRRMKKTIEAAPWGRHQYGYTLRHTGWEQRHLGERGRVPSMKSIIGYKRTGYSYG